MLQPKGTDWLNGYKNKTHIYAVYRLETELLQIVPWEGGISSLQGHTENQAEFCLIKKIPSIDARLGQDY